MRILLVIVALLASSPAYAADDRTTVTGQFLALAPNAGGQEAYSLRVARDSWEAGVFSNQYLLAGDKPLTGAVIDYRLPICDTSCFWQFFVQGGGGISNGGPVAEITWGSIIPLLPLWLPTSAPRYVPALRLDITTQFVFVRYRAVTWSYPLWVGVSISF